MIYFSVDGVEYPGLIITELSRSFSVLDGPNAGRSMNGNMIRDVIGTYYNYKMEVEHTDDEEYDRFYEVISSPTDSHVLVVPYAQSVLQFRAYITGGEDAVEVITNGKTKWGPISLSFVAMKPERIA